MRSRLLSEPIIVIYAEPFEPSRLHKWIVEQGTGQVRGIAVGVGSSRISGVSYIGGGGLSRTWGEKTYG